MKIRIYAADRAEPEVVSCGRAWPTLCSTEPHRKSGCPILCAFAKGGIHRYPFELLVKPQVAENYPPQAHNGMDPSQISGRPRKEIRAAESSYNPFP